MPLRPQMLEAPAKINLFLEILRRRSDGYHDIDTVFHQISLADRLILRPTFEEDRLSVTGAALTQGPDNLAMRALAAARNAGYTVPPLALSLAKKTPIGAGLGGGSADAAAVLRGLAQFLPASQRARFLKTDAPELGATLGADVPFFLGGGTSVGTGTGTDLKPVRPAGRPRKYWFALIFPGVSVSTPWAYKRLRFPLTNIRRSRTLEDAFYSRKPAAFWAPLLFNRLEEVVLPAFPAVARAKRALLKAGCLAALMSGSGSSVFGPVADEASGRKILKNLERGPRWKAWLVSSKP
jgi:4-diphosphocytidyl-2-C-methyl-D-erythritol kinase